MSKKTKVALISLLIFGGILLPGSFLINNLIRDLTYGSVDEGLLGIKDQGPDVIKETTLGMGPSAMALTLRGARDKGLDFSLPTVNSTIFLGQIYLISYLLTGYAQPKFWDEWETGVFNFSYYATINDYPPILGISQWFDTKLNFSTWLSGAFPDDVWGGVSRLKYGVNTTGWWGDRLPGIFEDTLDRIGWADWPPTYTEDIEDMLDMSKDRGFGILQIMDLIEGASEEEILNISGPNGYDLYNYTDVFDYNGEDCYKLELFYHYYKDYFCDDGLKLIIEGFNDNESAVQTDYPQYCPEDWNGYDTSYEDLVYYSFIEQWAKCGSFDNGFDFHDVEPSIPAGTYGIEPAGPRVDSNISMQVALQLWNESNPLALTNMDRIMKWYDARLGNDTAAYQELLTYYEQFPGYDFEGTVYKKAFLEFNETHMDLLLDWLWGNGGGWEQGSFYEERLPTLLTDSLCIEILLESWVDGTVFGEVLYPRGFPLPLGSVTIYGLEIGYQGPDKDVIPSNITLESAQMLWDPANPYSLTNPSGLQKWFAVVNGDDSERDTLINVNRLTDAQMDMLLPSIPHFQKDIMPYLAQYQYGLPADSITLGNIVQGVGVGMGITLIGLGAAGAIVSQRKKISTFKSKKSLDPFRLGRK